MQIIYEINFLLDIWNQKANLFAFLYILLKRYIMVYRKLLKMFCKNCGKQVNDGAVFCPYCGTKLQPVQYTQTAVSMQTSKKQSDSGNKSLMLPIIIAAAGILVVAGGIFFVLHINNMADEKHVVEEAAKDNEPEQTDAQYDFSFEEDEQDIASDTNEIDISQQEDVESDEVEEVREAEEEMSQYILPNSDSTYLTKSDLYGLTQEECRLARNELYARHGRKFDDEGLQEYFNSKDWYQGYVEPSDFNDSVLNEYEIANRDLIVQYEEEMGYR